MTPLQQLHAGTVPYLQASGWQRRLHDRRAADEIPDLLLMLEHPHVITLGRRFDPSHLLTGRDELAAKGIEVHETERGGSITYHGPGQLVLYPIVDLRATPQVTPDPIAYLRLLEQALVDACAELGVQAGTRPGLTGVWIGDDKIAAIGVHVSRGVARHGCALNLSTDLDYFSFFVPCGIPGAGVCSVESVTGVRVPVCRAARVLGRCLAAHLQRDLLAGSPADLPALLGRKGPDQPGSELIRA